MKILHISDLHIGKRVNEFSMLEDQKHIVNEIMNKVTETDCDIVVIAGDLYDKSMPSAEAVQLVDTFLTGLVNTGKEIYVISGNHDSAQRISYCGKLLEKQGLYVSREFDGKLQSFQRKDAFGELAIHLLPFIRPVQVRSFYPEEEIANYEQAVRAVLKHSSVDFSKRNILVGHQFVAGASVCDSEEHLIGGLDMLSAEVFEGFDYVALGHLHGPQKVSSERIRYSGSPLKYSFSEVNQNKSVTLITLNEKTDFTVELLPLHPVRDMRQLKGTLEECMGQAYSEDYMRIVLTDERMPMDAIGTLRTNFPNLMKLAIENGMQTADEETSRLTDLEQKSPVELFEEFYCDLSKNEELLDKQKKMVRAIFEKIGGAK